MKTTDTVLVAIGTLAVYVGVTVFALALTIGVVLLFSAPFAYLFMVLWNYVIPDLFNMPQIKFYQAWALMGLLGLVFGRFSVSPSKKE